MQLEERWHVIVMRCSPNVYLPFGSDTDVPSRKLFPKCSFRYIKSIFKADFLAYLILSAKNLPIGAVEYLFAIRWGKFEKEYCQRKDVYVVIRFFHWIILMH